MLKITKEAQVGTTTFVVDNGYFAVRGLDESTGAEAQFVMDRAEARELVKWLAFEFELTSNHVERIEPAPSIKEAPAVKKPSKAKEEVCTYDPGKRTATQTVELKLGDPSLAYSSMAGRGPGDGAAAVVDLGSMAGKVVVG